MITSHRGQRRREPGQKPQEHQREQLDQHERDRPAVDMQGGDLRRRNPTRKEQSRSKRRVDVGRLQFIAIMTPSQIGSTPGIISSAGATIGTTTKMISKASITKPSRSIASITITTAPAAPPGR
jgi:hypothetical protein